MRPFGKVCNIVPAGINGLMFYFEGATISEQNANAADFVRTINRYSPCWLVELLPSYNSVLVLFDIQQADTHLVYSFLASLTVCESLEGVESTHHVLPVWYNAPQASDFNTVSAHTGLSVDTIIRLHTESKYRVFAVGFTPGFAYLGDIPEVLACPRLTTPRSKVPKGAVAIADRQTAVYPSESPGGWNLLGLCPVQLTLIKKSATGVNIQALVKVGDTVQFTSVSEQEYKAYKND